LTPLRLVAIGVAGMVFVTIAFFVVAGSLIGGSDDVECATFRVEPGEWQRADFARRSDITRGIGQCELLDGRSKADVERLLGPPDRRAADASGTEAYTYEMPYDDGSDKQFYRVYFEGGRVSRTFTETPPTTIR